DAREVPRPLLYRELGKYRGYRPYDCLTQRSLRPSRPGVATQELRGERRRMHEEIKHPCVQHKLALLRDKATGYQEFRDLAKEITMFVCYEALKSVNVRKVSVQTPLAVARCHKIDEDLVVVPILRAGIGMLDGILGLVPTARVGFIGMYRDKE